MRLTRRSALIGQATGPSLFGAAHMTDLKQRIKKQKHPIIRLRARKAEKGHHRTK